MMAQSREKARRGYVTNQLCVEGVACNESYGAGYGTENMGTRRRGRDLTLWRRVSVALLCLDKITEVMCPTLKAPRCDDKTKKTRQIDSREKFLDYVHGEKQNGCQAGVQKGALTLPYLLTSGASPLASPTRGQSAGTSPAPRERLFLRSTSPGPAVLRIAEPAAPMGAARL